MIRLYLVRHGETDYNKELRIQGRIETDLNNLGIQQSSLTGEYLNKHVPQFDYCFVSPQKRAMQTFEIINSIYKKNNKINNIIISEDLKEIHCGRWEGRLYKELEQEEPEIIYKIRTDINFPYPEGESAQDVKKRSENFFKNHILNLSNGNQKPLNILIVSHGNLLRTLSTVILELPLEFSLKVIFHNAAISFIEEKPFIKDHFYKIIYWNNIQHLNHI